MIPKIVWNSPIFISLLEVTNMNQTKKSYQTPRLTVHGDASQLTQATRVGGVLDRTLPTDTPLSTVLTSLKVS